MKNSLTDLHNHLIAQVERLSDEALEGSGLAREVKRAEALAKVAAAIIQNARVVLHAMEYSNVIASMDSEREPLPPMLSVTDKK